MDKPAFPRDNQFIPNHVKEEKTGKFVEGSTGMSLRDWYAGMALQGMLSTDPHVCIDSDGGALMANACFRMADAMIKERDNE